MKMLSTNTAATVVNNVTNRTHQTGTKQRSDLTHNKPWGRRSDITWWIFD